MKCERCGKQQKRLLFAPAVLVDADRAGEKIDVCYECSEAIDPTSLGALQRLRESLVRLWDAIVDAVRGAA